MFLYFVDCSRDQALSPVGETLEVPSNDMNDETFSMTLMTTLDPDDNEPFVFDLRVGSNTQWDFLMFVTFSIYLSASVLPSFSGY